MARALAQTYHVPDIMLAETRLVFVLESPHVQELKYGAPVSGPSGATMTKHLFGEAYERYPLGRLVRKNVDDAVHRPRLDRIGLMNVCNIPMQAAAYDNRQIVQTHGMWMQAMATLRSSNQTDTYRDQHVEAVQTVLVLSLRRKLQVLADRPLTLVPCGRFAQKFFRLAGVQSPAWTVIDGVPHPSYNSWDRAQYQDAVARVCQALNEE
ncbi:hypothetical protein [Alicyclobacillus sp. ALC3]|uniref:hypothetical protein n=1 Tax=Alicyclobacillus sp. ALC3 TaxID=2796143 RepID=UPI002379776E|nr:hypothetical protein [Alicyclobacillus sp. ALC3]